MRTQSLFDPSNILAVLAVLLLWASQALAEARTLVQADDQGRITYVGEITAVANARAARLYQSAETRPETLLITSNGGRIDDSMDLAEWVFDMKLNVQVGAQCLSSCANYVFPAGKLKKLSRDSVLLWHGSAWQDSFDRLADPEHRDYRPDIAALRNRESRFYDHIGVDNLIAVHGLSQMTLRDRMRRTWGFDYSLQDLKHLGVNNIILLDGEWAWRKHKPENASRVRRAELDDDYRFERGRFARD